MSSSFRTALLLVLTAASVATADDWPQFRGPRRDNVSAETGLLTSWPEGGPKLLWTAERLGQSVVSVAVAKGRIFTIGYRGENEYIHAVDDKTGRKLWETRIGAAANELRLMRGLSQRIPTVDGERVYAVSFDGDLHCLDVNSGKLQWTKNYKTDWNGRQGSFWMCDQPFVDGDRLIVTPGGQQSTIIAINKKTGETIWKASSTFDDGRAHASLVPAELAGVKQYINQLMPGLLAVSADGKLLWRYDGLKVRTAATGAPLVRGDEVFTCSGYGVGIVLLKISRDGDKFSVVEVYRVRKSLQGWSNMPTRVGDHVFLTIPGQGLCCVEWATGKDAWLSKLGVGNHTFTVADGHLYLRDNNGKVFLVEATPKEFRKKGEFTPPRPDKSEPFTAPPVVANGRLYLRDMDSLYCFDVKAPPASRKPRDAGIFVPTPHDVVDKMLDLAGVTKDDLVVDLGCGDGRILVAAAKRGARAWGVDFDKECVNLARKSVAEANVGDRVTIEFGDLFDADFSKADVVVLYLLPTAASKLIPKLQLLKPGSRIVSHGFTIPGLKPDKEIRVTSTDDELERTIYLWRVPLKLDK